MEGNKHGLKQQDVQPPPPPKAMFIPQTIPYLITHNATLLIPTSPHAPAGQGSEDSPPLGSPEEELPGNQVGSI